MYKYNVNQQREEIAMIYAGTGKSTFCQEHPEAIDNINTMIFIPCRN